MNMTFNSHWCGIRNPFLSYRLTDTTLFIKKGFLVTKEEQIHLYRVTDMTKAQHIVDRLLKQSSIQILSSDKTCPCVILKNIKDGDEIRDVLNNLVERERIKHRTNPREVFDREVDYDVEDV